MVSLVRGAAPGELALVVLFATVYLVATTVSIVLTLRVFLPKDVPGTGLPALLRRYRQHAARGLRRESLALSAEGLERDALVQTHIVASIAADKFRRVRLALLLMIAALAAWLPLMAMANY